MRLEYILTEEDYIQFNINAAERLESYQKTMKLINFWKNITLICGILMLILLILEYSTMHLILLVGSIIVFLSALFYPDLTKYFIRKNVRSVLKSNAGRIIGKVTLEIDNERISAVTDGREGRVKLSNIKQVVLIEDYIFVYINDVEAFIIPKNVFNSKISEDEFISFINDYII